MSIKHWYSVGLVLLENLICQSRMFVSLCWIYIGAALTCDQYLESVALILYVIVSSTLCIVTGRHKPESFKCIFLLQFGINGLVNSLW